MTFSLINVSSRDAEGLVTGNWIQDVIGTIDDAYNRARSTEEANGNKISVAVVKGLPGTNPMLHGPFFKQMEL